MGYALLSGGGSGFSGTLTVPYIGNVNGAASTPALLLSGTIFTGGSATTTKPQLLVEPTGTTSTGWSTAGTLIGANAATGFTGNLLDLQLTGSSIFKVSSVGTLSLSGSIATGSSSSVTTRGIGTVSADTNFGVIANGANGTVSLGDMGAFPGSAGGGILNLYRGSGGTISAEFTPPAVSGGRTGLRVTPGAHTTVVAEVIDNSFAAHTMTITGGYTTNRFTLFAQPTISAATSLTVTNAATVAIADAPTATGAGPAVITNAYALWVQAGSVRLDGTLDHRGTNLGFYGVSVVARQTLATGTGKTVDNVITALQNLGLVSQT